MAFLNSFGVPNRIPVSSSIERKPPMARFRRTRRFISRVAARVRRSPAPAPQVTVIRAGGGSPGRARRFGRAFAAGRGGRESGKVINALVETGAAMGAGALAGASEGLATTDGEKKSLPWVRRGIALGLNYVAENFGGRGARLVRGVANGVAGADGALTVQRRASVVTSKSPGR